MRTGNITVIATVFLLSIAIAGAAGSAVPLTTSVSVLNQWLPIAVLAVIASVCIALIYYMIGIILGNRSIVSAAFSEFENVLGTVVIVVIILILLNFFGSSAFPSLLMSQTNAQGLCTTLQGANLNFINATQQDPTNTICTGVIPSAGQGGSSPNPDQLTNNLDYGLASTYLVVANMTNQTTTNLNAYFIFRGYMTFLSTFNASDTMCWPGAVCQEYGTTGGAFSVKYIFSPFAGYEQLLGSAKLLTEQSTLVFYLFVIQLMVIIVLLYAWPYMLAAGIILRASFLTRRVGGLLIAMTLVGLLVYPAIFLIQYNALNNLNLGSQPVAPIGPTSFNSMQLIGSPTYPASTTQINYDSRLNFYVFPRADYIITYNGCWPPKGSVGLGELQIIGAYVIPGLGILNAGINLLNLGATSAGSGPVLQSSLLRLGFTCNSNNAIQTVFSLYNLYGMMSIIGLILPLINVLMVLAALFSLSSLLGGDTRIFGLERLV